MLAGAAAPGQAIEELDMQHILIALPEGAPVEARDNIATALTLAAGDTANGPALVAAASAAFDNAYLVVMYVGAALLAAGAIVTGVLLRRYGPGSQSSLYPSSH